MRLRDFFRKHAVALVLSLIVGGLTVAPHVMAVRSLGDDYQGIPFLFLDDEDHYLARAREIADGHWPVSSPFFFEYKDQPAVIPPLGELLYIALSWLLFTSMPIALVAAKFIFPAVLFLLVYFLSRRIMGDEKEAHWPAIASALWVCLVYELVTPDEIVQLLQGRPETLRLSIWTRPVNPITGGLLVFGYLLCLQDIFFKKRSWAAIPAGLILAAMISYFFSWSITLSVTAFLGLALAYRHEWKPLKTVVLALVVWLLASSSYWISLVLSLNREGDGTALRNGLFYTRDFLMNKTLVLSLALYAGMWIFYHYRSKKQAEPPRSELWIFGLVLLLGGLWALNQQMLTGRTIWPYHFVQYTKPFAVIALATVAYAAFSPVFPRLWRIAVFGFVGFAFFNGIAMAATYPAKLDVFKKIQSYAPIYSWLEQNAPKDCVVLVKEEGEYLARQIPAFTQCNIYHSNWVMSGVTAERIRHNFYVYLKMNGITPDGAEGYLKNNGELVRAYFFDDWKTLYAKGQDKWLEKRTRDVVEGYKDFVKKDFTTELARYRLDYVLTPYVLSVEEERQFGVKSPGIQAGDWRIYQR